MQCNNYVSLLNLHSCCEGQPKTECSINPAFRLNFEQVGSIFLKLLTAVFAQDVFIVVMHQLIMRKKSIDGVTGAPSSAYACKVRVNTTLLLFTFFSIYSHRVIFHL